MGQVNGEFALPATSFAHEDVIFGIGKGRDAFISHLRPSPFVGVINMISFITVLTTYEYKGYEHACQGGRHNFSKFFWKIKKFHSVLELVLTGADNMLK